MKKFGCLAPFTALLLFSALPPSKALTTAADKCAVMGAAFIAGEVVPIKTAHACVYSFPYDSRRSALVLDSVYKIFQLHTYNDISIKSPTPEFDVNIDVLESLRKINSTIYPNDFAFNYAIFSVINALKDLNAAYEPSCYYALESFTAFPLVKFLNPSGIGELVQISSHAGFVQPKIVHATEKHLNLKVADYAGATLLEINNKDPVAYIEQQAKKGGGFKDLNARINQMYFRKLASGDPILGDMMALRLLEAPTVPFIKYKLIRAGRKTTETIRVPYFVNLGLYAQNFTSATDYFNLNCLSPTYVPPAAAATSASAGDVSTSRRVHKKMAAPKAWRTRIKASLSNLLLHLDPDVVKGRRRGRRMKRLGSPTDFIKAFILADRKTGVLFIPNFFGPDSLNFYEKWQLDIYNGIIEIKAAGGTRLILDVQDNLGGLIDHAYALIEYLFPAIEHPQYPIQYAATPLVTEMVRATTMDLEKTDSFLNSPSGYRWYGLGAKPGQSFLSSDGYFFPTIPLTYNGRTSNYSSLLYDNDRVVSGSVFGFYYRSGFPSFGIDFLVPPPGVITPQFETNQILILSNGGCFSECSTFSYLMQEAGVKIISVGGSLGKPMAYSAGTCGRVSFLEGVLVFDLQYLNLTNADGAPQESPLSAFVGFTQAQSFCNESSTIPADFVFKPADHRFAYTKASVERVEALYKQAATYFP